MLNFKKKYLKYKKKYLNLSGGEPKPWREHTIDDYKNCINLLILYINSIIIGSIRSTLGRNEIYFKEFIINKNNDLKFIKYNKQLLLNFLKFKLEISVKDINILYTLEYCKNNSDFFIRNSLELSKKINVFSYYQKIPDTLSNPTSFDFITDEYIKIGLNELLKLNSNQLLIPTIENYKICINFMNTFLKDTILFNIKNKIEYSLILCMNGEILSIVNDIASIFINNIIISTIKYIIQIKIIIIEKNTLKFEISYCFSYTDRVLNSISNVQIDPIQFNNQNFLSGKKNIDLNNIKLDEIKNIDLNNIKLDEINVILTYIHNIIKLKN